jgi:hypothetical protein
VIANLPVLRSAILPGAPFNDFCNEYAPDCGSRRYRSVAYFHARESEAEMQDTAENDSRRSGDTRRENEGRSPGAPVFHIQFRLRPTVSGLRRGRKFRQRREWKMSGVLTILVFRRSNFNALRNLDTAERVKLDRARENPRYSEGRVVAVRLRATSNRWAARSINSALAECVSSSRTSSSESRESASVHAGFHRASGMKRV